MILMVIFAVPLVAGGVVFTLPAEQIQAIIDALSSLGLVGGLVIGTLVLIGLAYGLTQYGLYRFRRSRMILDLSG